MVTIQRPSVNCLAMFVVLLVMNRPVEPQTTTVDPMMNNNNMNNMNNSGSGMASPTPGMMIVAATMTPTMSKTTDCSMGMKVGDKFKVEVKLMPNSTFKLDSIDDFMFKYQTTEMCKVDFPTCDSGRMPCHCVMMMNNMGYKAVLNLEANTALSETMVHMVWKGMNNKEMKAMENVGKIMDVCKDSKDKKESSSAPLELSSVWLILLGTAITNSM